ncbi:MAG: DUF4307 domain-containing protein [Pseudonocardiaceae bacterium]
MSIGQLPEDRYGRRVTGRRSRWLQLLGMALAALAGLVVAVIGYYNLADPPVQGEALGFELLAEPNAVSLRFEVVREDPARPAVCVVRARSRDGEETGRKEVYVPPAAGSVELTTVIRTSRPPVTADVYGCSLQVPDYVVPSPG